MQKNKALGLNGFIVEFSQATWSFMGQDILDVVEESRCNQKVCPSLNSTFIALIPKTAKSNVPQCFRPISVCNVIYKIIATLVVKRLNPLLPNLISPKQAGFVEGQQILDVFITSQEVVHSLKSQKIPGMMIKLDLSKAYDRINWGCLSSILKAYNFSQRWINWILAMISSLLQGLRIWGNDMPITHQQFVDDIMVFCQATLKEARSIRYILNTFMEALGTKINNEKYHIFFFNTQGNVKKYLAKILRFSTRLLPSKCLGMPLSANPLRNACWQNILQKLQGKLNCWTFRSLNITSRTVLLKAVLQLIPIYQLLGMVAPKGACSKMVYIFKKCLWGGAQQIRKWALVSWKGLIKKKANGRLGLKDPYTLNQTM
eukprot:PITA_26169